MTDRLYWLTRAAVAAHAIPDNADAYRDWCAEVTHIERMLGDRDDLEPFFLVPRREGEPLIEYVERAPVDYLAEIEAELREQWRAEATGETFDAWCDRVEVAA